MQTIKRYKQVKASCKFCGRPRDGKPGLLCKHCRREYWREGWRKRQAAKGLVKKAERRYNASA